MSLVEPVDKVVNLIPSSVDPTLMLGSVTQAVDPFPFIDHIIPLENITQVVDLILSSVNPTLPLENNPDTAHFFLVDTESTMLGGIPPYPVEPPPSNEAILFYWGVLIRPRLPYHIPFNITLHICGWDVPRTLIDEGGSISIFSSISWKALSYPHLVSVTQNLLYFIRRTNQHLGTLP
jgi:hypothetical protein